MRQLLTICCFLVAAQLCFAQKTQKTDSTYIFSLKEGDATLEPLIANTVNADGQVNYRISKIVINRDSHTYGTTSDTISFYARNFKWENLPYNNMQDYSWNMSDDINTMDTMLLKWHNPNWGADFVKVGPVSLGPYARVSNNMAVLGKHYAFCYKDEHKIYHIVHDGMDQVLPIVGAGNLTPTLINGGKDYIVVYDALYLEGNGNSNIMYRPGKRSYEHVCHYQHHGEHLYIETIDPKSRLKSIYFDDKIVAKVKYMIDHKVIGDKLTFSAIDADSQAVIYKNGKLEIQKLGIYDWIDGLENPNLMVYSPNFEIENNEPMLQTLLGSNFRPSDNYLINIKRLNPFYLYCEGKYIGPYSDKARLPNVVWSKNNKHWAAIMYEDSTKYNHIICDGKLVHSFESKLPWEKKSKIVVSNKGDVAYTMQNSSRESVFYKNKEKIKALNDGFLLDIDDNADVTLREKNVFYKNENVIFDIKNIDETDYLQYETQVLNQKKLITVVTKKGQQNLYLNNQLIIENVMEYKIDEALNMIYAFVNVANKVYFIKKAF